jgi:hypothetical protein
MAIELIRPITDAELLKAVEIRRSKTFPALNIANALAGAQTEVWQLIRKYSLNELLEECKMRGLQVDGDSQL